MIDLPSRTTQRPPEPRGYPLLGNLSEMQRKGMLAFYCDLRRDYGDLVHLKMGPLHQLMLTQLTILLNARDEETGIAMDKQQLYDEVLTISRATKQPRRRSPGPGIFCRSTPRLRNGCTPSSRKYWAGARRRSPTRRAWCTRA